MSEKLHQRASRAWEVRGGDRGAEHQARPLEVRRGAWVISQDQGQHGRRAREGQRQGLAQGTRVTARWLQMLELVGGRSPAPGPQPAPATWLPV